MIAVKLELILFQFSLVPLKLHPVVRQLAAVMLNLAAAGAVAQILSKLTPIPEQFTRDRREVLFYRFEFLDDRFWPHRGVHGPTNDTNPNRPEPGQPSRSMNLPQTRLLKEHSVYDDSFTSSVSIAWLTVPSAEQS